MEHIVASSLAVVFALLGGVHLFWAFGGTLGIGAAVPEVDGRRVFMPTPAATLGVAVALFSASLLILGRAGLLGSRGPVAPLKWPVLALGLVFMARAVGEFRFVGFFKRVRGTAFARWDTFVFSPLCLALGLGTFWLGLE